MGFVILSRDRLALTNRLIWNTTTPEVLGYLLPSAELTCWIFADESIILAVEVDRQAQVPNPQKEEEILVRKPAQDIEELFLEDIFNLVDCKLEQKYKCKKLYKVGE